MAFYQGQDKNTTMSQDGFLCGLYYYYLDKNLVQNNNLTIPLQLPTIQTLNFYPFFNHKELNPTICDLDYNYFKVNKSIQDLKVYRVNPYTLRKELSTYSFNEDLKKHVNNNDEIATQLYPYKYYLLSDGINPPLLLKPQDMIGNKITPIVETYLTQSSKYKVYVKEHRNDRNGELESIVNNTSFMLPIGTNTYNNFMVTNGNTYQATNSLAFLENNKNYNQASASLNLDQSRNNANFLTSALSGIVGMLGGNVIGGVSQIGYSAVNQVYNGFQNDLNKSQSQENYNFKNYQIETLNLAKKNDFLNTPRTMKTLGNDGLFNLNNTNGNLCLYTFEVEQKKKEQLNEYYRRYGYKINNYKLPNTKSKKYYNFIKTVNCNLDSNKVPHEDLEELQRIYDSGVTIWHVNNNAVVGVYNANNEDVE